LYTKQTKETKGFDHWIQPESRIGLFFLFAPSGYFCFMRRVKGLVLFITGTDTGVGKTLLTCLLIRHLQGAGPGVPALKPVCSGDRNDARLLLEASRGVLSLAQINPWHFRAPLAPLAAARREGKLLRLENVLAHVRRIQRRFPALLVEGAGGLLSPLGENFNSLDLIVALRAVPIIVSANRLGVINQVLLVQAALPRAFSRRSHVVLMSVQRPDSSSRENAPILKEKLGPDRVHVLPWLRSAARSSQKLSDPKVREVCKAVGSLLRVEGEGFLP
jgi:dethiobiotin synthetase